jgi:protein SSD1
LLKDSNFSTADFAEAVLKCLPPIPYSIPPRELEIRRDFRDTRLFTIDPSTAKDLDDAMSITRLENGNYEVGVHIADVSYFVKSNVALDREARKRGTTVYLVQRAIHMLPAALVEVCSLTPDEDKLAFSVIFTLTPEARVVGTWVGKTVIRSCGQLSYDQVQNVIAGNELEAKILNKQSVADVKTDLLDLAALARQLTAARFEGNALKLDKIKLTFELDNSGQPIDCTVQQQNEAQRLIEEVRWRVAAPDPTDTDVSVHAAGQHCRGAAHCSGHARASFAPSSRRPYRTPLGKIA